MIATGTDILHISRMHASIERHGEAFLKRVFTSNEIAYCRCRAPELAVRFAAKEAASKMLGVGMRILSEHGIGWHEAEVVNDDKGKPILLLHGRAAELARALGLSEWSLSLTHERDVALAFVVGMS